MMRDWTREGQKKKMRDYCRATGDHAGEDHGRAGPAWDEQRLYLTCKSTGVPRGDLRLLDQRQRTSSLTAVGLLAQVPRGDMRGPQRVPHTLPIIPCWGTLSLGHPGFFWGTGSLLTSSWKVILYYTEQKPILSSCWGGSTTSNYHYTNILEQSVQASAWKHAETWEAHREQLPVTEKNAGHCETGYQTFPLLQCWVDTHAC